MSTHMPMSCEHASSTPTALARTQAPRGATALIAIVVAGAALVGCGKSQPVTKAVATPGPAAVEVPTPTRPPAPDLPYKVIESTQGWGDLQYNRSVKNLPLSVNGTVYASGLGTHALARITISFPASYKTFSGRCGVDDEEAGRGTVVFKILDGGNVVFQSPLMKGGMAAVDFSVPVAGRTGLVLVADDGGDGVISDHADWLDLKLQ